MTFAKREISLTFTLGDGTFADSGTNQMTVTGLRILCNIVNVGGITLGEAQLRVYGLTRSQLNDLSALNRGFMVQRDIRLQINAGDSDAGLNLIFDGQVIVGQIDLNSVPDSALVVIAQAGILQALQGVQPNSYPNNTNHLIVMKDLANKMGLRFESTGDAIPLAKPYFPGTLRDQVIRCADMAGVNWAIDNGILAVWPMFGARQGLSVPLVSPDTGLVGYPGYSDIGIALTTLFNPFIRIGGLVTVESSLPFANGSWIAFYIRHELESEIPGGKWFTSFNGAWYLG